MKKKNRFFYIDKQNNHKTQNNSLCFGNTEEILQIILNEGNVFIYLNPF